jgi:hypothetical protein
MRLMVLGFDSVNGKWYSFCLERSTFGLITWVNSKTWLTLLVIIIWPTKSNCLTSPHIKLVHYNQTGHLLSMLMCTHPCSTHQTPQVVRIAATAQERTKPPSIFTPTLILAAQSRSNDQAPFSPFPTASSGAHQCYGGIAHW